MRSSGLSGQYMLQRNGTSRLVARRHCKFLFSPILAFSYERQNRIQPLRLWHISPGCSCTRSVYLIIQKCSTKTDNVLSDGGGIRGYGTLFILEELMKECHRWEEIIDSQNGRDPDHDNANTPLPCEYFDYFAGTSTGGSVKRL